MKAGVITFPGSNCNKDLENAFVKTGFSLLSIWHKDFEIPNDIDVIGIPGGFSYGDYLRTGAIAARSPIMNEVVRHNIRGTKIIGICNGFQILTEVKLLDGVLMVNKNRRFICDNVNLKIVNKNTNFTKKFTKDVLEIPIAHMDGNYLASPDIIKQLEDNEQIAFKYCDDKGLETELSNPNGSLNNIAGIFNKRKNILGMMPHPERVIDKMIGGFDGTGIFESLFQS